MSLVVLSSQQAFNEGAIAQNIEQPNRFQNHFTKPIEVPADAEVALINAKINRSQNFNIGKHKSFHLYLGTELQPGQTLERSSTSCPISIDLYNPDEKSLSFEEMRVRLEDAINENIGHPNFVGRTNVSFTLSESGEINAFTYELRAKQRGSSNSSQVSEIWQPFSFESEETFETTPYGDNGRAITRLEETGTPGAGICVGTDTPLDPCSGIFEFSASGLGETPGGWMVGLTRPLQLFENPNGHDAFTTDDVYPEWFTPHTSTYFGDAYFDFGLACESDGTLRIYQTGHNGNPRYGGSDRTELSEVQYWTSEVNSSYSGDSPISVSVTSAFRFIIKNEELSLETYDEEFGDWATLIKPNQTSVAFNQVFRPVGQNEWSLYPIVEIMEQDTSLHLNFWEGAYKDDTQVIPVNYYTDNYYSRQYLTSANHQNTTHLQLLDNRSWNNIQRNPHFYVWSSLRGSGANSSVDKSVVLIVAEEQQYTPSYVFHNPNVDMRDILGFNATVLPESKYAVITSNGDQREFTSTTSPIGDSTREVYIKCDSLNIESYNGATSDISKILYSVPRFDNSGGAVGSLFFENNDRYYLKLNNPSPLLLNRMDISLVNVDNRLVQGLYGNSVISLHIRKSQ